MVGIYARQSLDKKDSISIETQIELCKKEIPDGEEFRVYTDKGFSGKNTNRPEFQRLMDDVERGEINRVIVYRLDRISRSIADFAGIMNILEQKQISFVSVTEKFDTSTPMGRAMLYIVMVFAQLERETIAERIRDNYYSRGKLGVWLGGPAPFGFELTKSTLNGKNVSTIHPSKEIDIVTKIFDDYATTAPSLGAIARDLRSVHGDAYGIWNNIKLARILHNPIYVKADADVYNYYKEKGCIMVNDIEEYDGTHGLIIYGKRDHNLNKYKNINEHVVVLSLSNGFVDSSVFLSCQYKMEKNKQIKNTGKGKHTWMSGLMKCADCGYSLSVKGWNGINYLYCTGHQHLHICPGGGGQTLFLAETENVVDNLVYKYLQDVDRSTPVNESEKHTNEGNQIKIKLHKLNEQIDNLIAGLMDANNVTMEYINRKIAALDSEKQDLLKQLETHTIKPIKKEIPTPEEWRTADRAKKHDLAQLIINRILIKKNSINIVWKY